MLRKTILGAIALLLLAPPAYVALENFRGRTELEAVLTDLRTKGEEFDIGNIAPRPVPAASNAIDHLVAAVDRLKLDPDLQPIALRWIGPGRAVAGARRADWTSNSGRVVEWSELAQWKSNHQATLDELRAAIDAPFRQPVLDYSQGFKVLLPHLAKMKSAVNVLGACLSESAHRKDFAAALDDLEDMRRVAKDLEQQPLLIDQLVRIACEAIATSRAWELLHSHDWTSGQLAELQSAMPQVELMQGIVHSLTGERALVLKTIRNLTTRELLEMGDTAAGANPPSSVSVAGTALARITWGDQAVAQYLKALQTMIEANRQAAKAQSLKHLESLDTMLPIHRLHPRYFLARMILPSLDRAGTKALRAETERALLVTGIALQRYQRDHNGRPPENLQALVPAYLDAVPIDRMDGNPLRYRVETDGTFTLWSLGQDLTDNGGDGNQKPEATRDRVNASWWLANDAVWPRHATKEEIAAWQQEEGSREERKKNRASRPNGPPQALDPELLKRYGLTPPTNAAAKPPAP